MHYMASLSILIVLEQSQVSPSPATIGNRLLPLSFFDIVHLLGPPIRFLFFYELPLTKTQFTETIVPNLKHYLSTTLQHFFPYAGNLIVFPARTRNPEIRYYHTPFPEQQLRRLLTAEVYISKIRL